MNKGTRILLLGLAVVCLGLAVVRTLAGHYITGGERTFLAVGEALRTNKYLLEQVGSPVTAVAQNDGPSHVLLATDGLRSGYYSVTAKGPKGVESLKAYWRELAGGTVKVYALFRTKALAQDQFVWGSPPETGAHGWLRVFFNSDPHGHASLVGIPLRNRYLRDGMFKTLHALGCDIQLRSNAPITNSVQTSNLVDTLIAIERLRPPQTNTAPSPYE